MYNLRFEVLLMPPGTRLRMGGAGAGGGQRSAPRRENVCVAANIFQPVRYLYAIRVTDFNVYQLNLGGGMVLVNRRFCVPAMRATLAVILAMGSPLAGGTLQMAGWRLFGSC